jgi:hypothetical protein
MSTSTILRKTPSPRPLPIYFAEVDYGCAKAFQETDRDRNSRQAIVEMIRSGEIEVVKVIEINEINGTVFDVTDELVSEALAQREAA